MSPENWSLLIGLGQLIFAILLFLNIDKAYVIKRIPNIRFRSAAIYILIVGGFAFSGYGFYLANKRPKERIVEKTIEKPVDRIVDKVVQVPCPTSHAKGGSVDGVTIPPNTTITATTNAPDSMAAGINTGTMIKGDPPSQFAITNVARNVATPDGLFKTEFSLQVTTKHPVRLFVKVAAPSLVGDMEWGQNSLTTRESTGPGFAQRTVLDLYAGTYTVKAYCTKPETVAIQYEER
jgi:hypothetical protein